MPKNLGSPGLSDGYPNHAGLLPVKGCTFPEDQGSRFVASLVHPRQG